jgi:hypothetical protein
MCAQFFCFNFLMNSRSMLLLQPVKWNDHLMITSLNLYGWTILYLLYCGNHSNFPKNLRLPFWSSIVWSLSGSSLFKFCRKILKLLISLDIQYLRTWLLLKRHPKSKPNFRPTNSRRHIAVCNMNLIFLSPLFSQLLIGCGSAIIVTDLNEKKKRFIDGNSRNK